MARIPDKLLKDIFKYLDEWQGVDEKQTEKHGRFVYAIDLTVEWEDKK